MAINSSLMTLGRCLEVLRWNQQQQQQQQQHKAGPGTGLLPPPQLRVVPYRESRVTHLFRDALHGWGQVVLSVNVSPAARDYDETAHVLKVGWGGVGGGRQAGRRVDGGDSGGGVWIAQLPPSPCPTPAPMQYAALATQIGTIQQAEAPRRTLQAVSPAIKKAKRKAALPPEARAAAAGGAGGAGGR